MKEDIIVIFIKASFSSDIWYLRTEYNVIQTIYDLGCVPPKTTKNEGVSKAS